MIAVRERKEYLSGQLITYLGNKRNLLGFIVAAVEEVRVRLGKEKISVFDLFSGSGIVARCLKQFAESIAVNDLERYSEVINRCYLSNEDEVPMRDLNEAYRWLCDGLGEENLRAGWITELYSPRNEMAVDRGERCFYTPRNARYLDTARRRIGELPEEFQPYFLAPLLAEASVHANTSGVFKGFYKNRETGIGQYGGSGRNALSRILGAIEVKMPVFSRFSCPFRVFRGDATAVAAVAGEFDLAYIDPPYNQHPYGANYFMLNLLTDYRRPESVSAVSGIPRNWNRSEWNRRGQAVEQMRHLAEAVDAKFLLISFNSEGFISLPEMTALLERIGSVKVTETDYNAFRGSRNLKARNLHLKEYLFLVEKK